MDKKEIKTFYNRSKQLIHTGQQFMELAVKLSDMERQGIPIPSDLQEQVRQVNKNLNMIFQGGNTK